MPQIQLMIFIGQAFEKTAGFPDGYIFFRLSGMYQLYGKAYISKGIMYGFFLTLLLYLAGLGIWFTWHITF